jgi:hypothetical protein
MQREALALVRNKQSTWGCSEEGVAMAPVEHGSVRGMLTITTPKCKPLNCTLNLVIKPRINSNFIFT